MPNESLIIDTGFFLALASRQDSYHQKAKKLLKQTEEMRWITTWPVIVETCHMIGRTSPQEVVKFLDLYFNGTFTIFDLNKEHIPKIQILMHKYIDLPMDLADASLVILAEHLGSGKILSTDKRDFHTYKWKNHLPFQNLFI